MSSPLQGVACRRLLTPTATLDNVLVMFDGDRIGQMGEFASSHLPPGVFDARTDEVTVTPGFIDVHMHGCGGRDFLDRAVESIEFISATAATGGATSIVAGTTIPTDDTDLSGFKRFIHAYHTARISGARLLGIHLEGPFLNPAKRGGFGPKFVRPVDLGLVREILDLCGPDLVKVTLSPEIPGAPELVDLLAAHTASAVQVSVGHTTAGYDLAKKCFDHPRVRTVTHGFNAMEPFHHRHPGLIGAALTDDRVTIEMIPDGHHLSPAAIQILYKLKGPQRLAIVTDGTAATATPEGTPIESVGGTTLVKDDAVRLLDGTLAGSNLLMAGAVEAACRLGEIPLRHAVEMATLTPAHSVGKDAEVGSVEPGKRADFCVLRDDGSVAATIRDGIVIHTG